jgi:hypothetical protein
MISTCIIASMHVLYSTKPPVAKTAWPGLLHNVLAAGHPRSTPFNIPRLRTNSSFDTGVMIKGRRVSGQRAWDRDGRVKLPERLRHLRPGMVLGVSDNARGQQVRAEMPNRFPAGRRSGRPEGFGAGCFVRFRHGGRGWHARLIVPMGRKACKRAYGPKQMAGSITRRYQARWRDGTSKRHSACCYDICC